MAENKQLYFGSIKLLKIFGAYTSTTIFDAYAVTNILVYILVFPLWIWFWIIKILKICKKR